MDILTLNKKSDDWRC